MSMRPLGDAELATLTVEQARQMPEDDMRDLFAEIVFDLVGTFGKQALPANFPTDPRGMSREAILAAVEEHAYWVDPEGGHPAPDVRDPRYSLTEEAEELQKRSVTAS